VSAARSALSLSHPEAVHFPSSHSKVDKGTLTEADGDWSSTNLRNLGGSSLSDFGTAPFGGAPRRAHPQRWRTMTYAQRRNDRLVTQHDKCADSCCPEDASKTCMRCHRHFCSIHQTSRNICCHCQSDDAVPAYGGAGRVRGMRYCLTCRQPIRPAGRIECTGCDGFLCGPDCGVVKQGKVKCHSCSNGATCPSCNQTVSSPVRCRRCDDGFHKGCLVEGYCKRCLTLLDQATLRAAPLDLGLEYLRVTDGDVWPMWLLEKCIAFAFSTAKKSTRKLRSLRLVRNEEIAHDLSCIRE
jgi:hypothetical protein